MKFGLTDQIIASMVQVFETNPKVDKAFIFGSRAKGNFRDGSDIDIAIKGQDLSFKDIISLSGKLEDLDIPYKIDLLDYHTIKEPALQEHIDRVGIEFYSRWKKVRLGKLCTKIGSGATPTGGSNAYKTAGISLIRSQNVLDFKFGYDGLAFIDDEQAFALKNVTVKENDILLNITGDSVARVCKVPNEVLPARVNQHVAILRAKDEKLNNDFLLYQLQAKKENLLILSEIGGTRNALTKLMIEEFEIILPPLTEQTAIASILSSLDDKIDLLQRQNKTLEQLAETLFRQWFVEEAEETWEEKKLGELLTITSSKRIFYSEYVSSGVPFYRSKEIIELRNTGSTNSELYIPNERFDEINNKFGSPKEGDILMTSVGTLGVAYRVRKTDMFYFKDGNLTWFKDFKGLPSSIVYLWLISKIGQEELAAITIGSTQEALTIEGLKSISFKIPPKESINLYETEFNTIIDKIEFNQTQIRTLTQTRDTLLPKLMSGEVRVQMQ